MKKIIYLLAAAALFAACDKNDGGNTNDDPAVVEDGTYVGTVTVATPQFTKDDVTVKITFGEDGTADIEMLQVKFAEAMPVTLDMKIPGVTTTETAGGIVLSGDGIVPLVGPKEFPAYTITGLTGSVTSSALSFSMSCGAFPTSFSGTAAPEE